MTFLVVGLIVCVVGIALWMVRLVKDINERFDQLEHKLDLVLDQLDRSPLPRSDVPDEHE